MKKRFLTAALCLLSATRLVGAQESAESIFIEPAAAPYRIWGGAEYLVWWVKANALSTPIVTTTTNPFASVGPVNVAAGIGRPGTSILLGPGGAGIDYGALSGSRFTIGVWLNPEATVGIEGRGFLLEQGTWHRTFASGPAGLPVIGNPFTDVASVLIGGENAVVQSFPGLFAGDTSVTSTTCLWGSEVNGVFGLSRSAPLRIDALAGLRYANLSEDITLQSRTSNLTPLPAGFGVSFLNQSFNGTTTATDDFRTRNEFYGGQIGARAEAQMGRAFVNITGKLALGSTHQQVDVRGTSTLVAPGTPLTTVLGGTYAVASNMGTLSRDAFSVMPEVDLRLGYNVTSRLRGFVGYNFLYWSDVARAGQEFDRRLDIRQVPTVAGFDPTIKTAPPLTLRSTDFWAQGVSFGLEFRY